MQTSLFLAKLIGPFFLVMGIGMLANRAGYRAMAQEFLKSRALIYIAGLLAFLPGLAIVLTHNVWAADWRVIITLLGWLGVIGGIFRLLCPQQVTKVGSAMLAHDNPLLVGGIGVILLGGLISYFGYFT